MQEINHSSPKTKAVFQQRQLLTDMRAQNYDVIRFATYRTACKLRFIQKKANLHLVDIWNIIEAFRENGLNMVDPQFELSVSRIEALLTIIYTQLNKRLPHTQQISVGASINMLLNWLIMAYDKDNSGKIQAFTIKVALSNLCAGKFVDKLRYVFTQISDVNGYLDWLRFEDYMVDLLMLPTAVFEGPSFGYNETAARSCFSSTSRVSVNDFLNVLMSDPGPQCLMWLPVLNRMAHVENVLHPILCEGCHRESFTGFRYKCQRCFNYNLCQDCFWRGRTSGNHRVDHELKEYTHYKSQAKQISHSIRKSLQCTPINSNQKLSQFPEIPEKTIDLSFIVPPTPNSKHNGFLEHPIISSGDLSSLDTSFSAPRSPSKHNASTESCRIDDEHRLIARYAARLAVDNSKASQSPTELNFSLDNNKAQRELITQLESKNRDIMREIQRLRLEQDAFTEDNDDSHYSPTLLAELRLLRQRKDELEGRMQALQESRKDLMVQLESLMKLLKNHPTSPRSSPTSSPRSHSGVSPSVASSSKISTPNTSMDTSLTGLGGDVRQAFHQTPTDGGQKGRSLRNDLLVAADSVTNAMSSLVKELNSENSGSEDEDEINGKSLGRSQSSSDNYENDSMVRSTGTDDIESWRDDIRWRLKQESEFLAQLRARRQRSGSSSLTTSDNEQDPFIPDEYDESYVRTGDSSAIYTDESLVNTEENFSIKDVQVTETAEMYDNQPGELMTSSRYTTDEDSYLQTDDESYIRTDDEEGGNTDWEESTRRWVNR